MADLFARVTALGGLALGASSFAWQAWTKRHRVTVTLGSGVHATPESQIEFALVSIRNIGRPISVESINFDWRDSQPQPRQFGWSPMTGDINVNLLTGLGISGSAIRQEVPSMGLGAPQLPYLLADGETRNWSFRPNVSYETFDASIYPNTDTRTVRAKVTFTSGKTVLSNDRALRLRPVTPPTSNP
jgi:hypothetical protein